MALSPMAGHPIIERLAALFRERGDTAYVGEPVSVADHMLQAAALAVRDDAPEPLVAAALLHDVGHLLTDLPEDAAEHGIDSRHEALGARFLRQHVPRSVSGPVALHVAAKRYLCAAEPGYQAALSPASRLSLALQGGAMSQAQAERFAADPAGRAAVRLRRWDEAAKDPAARVPGFDHYRPLLAKLLDQAGADPPGTILLSKQCREA